MDIKNRLRELLIEAEESKGNKFGCVMAYLKYDKSEWKKLQDMIEEDDLSTSDGDNREDNPHVTILYGLHKEVKDSEIKEKVDNITKLNIKLDKISCFDGDDFDVLKFEIISDEIRGLNKDFGKLPHTNTFDTYQPHCTIAFLKKGLGKKYMDKLNGKIDIEVTPDKIVYSKIDGSEKDYKLKKKNN